MTKAILSLGALIAVAVALAGCGGGGGARGNTGSVAGAHHAHGSANFRASVHSFEAQLQTSVHAFQGGNLSKAIASGGPVLNNCMGVLDAKVAPHASTPAQHRALAHLRTACGQVTQAVDAGSSGNMTQAKQFANEALAEARNAARLAG